ncbi:MAG: HD domain-containing protein [Candidatus Hodarchaeota archaeon]
MIEERDEKDLKELIDGFKAKNRNANEGLISKAFFFSKMAHEGQKRKGGADFFIHPLEVAKMLSKLGADEETVCAALLHDVVEDTEATLDEVREEFGEKIAFLVEALTKTSIDFENKAERKARYREQVKKATEEDRRVLLIKLADRLHNIKTLHVFEEKKRVHIAKETLDFYVPLARKYGLEDFAKQLKKESKKYLNEIQNNF